MKARIKSTGDIMPIAPYAKVTLSVCDDRGTPYEVDFEDIELINEDEVGCDFDWSSFRREAAKDILCALIGNSDGFAFRQDKRAGEIEVSDALSFADELIKQLKQE